MTIVQRSLRILFQKVLIGTSNFERRATSRLRNNFKLGQKCALCVIIFVIIHKNNIAQTRTNWGHQSACDNSEASRMIQTKIGAQQNFKHLIQVHLYFHSREPLKNPQNTKDHIATTFNRFIPGGNRRVYLLNKSADESCRFLFKCVWHFGTTWRENELKRSKGTYQNQNQNLFKIYFSF